MSRKNSKHNTSFGKASNSDEDDKEIVKKNTLSSYNVVKKKSKIRKEFNIQMNKAVKKRRLTSRKKKNPNHNDIKMNIDDKSNNESSISPEAEKLKIFIFYDLNNKKYKDKITELNQFKEYVLRFARNKIS